VLNRGGTKSDITHFKDKMEEEKKAALLAKQRGEVD